MDAATARQRSMAALRRLAEKRPVESLNYGEIAGEAGLPWQTVKRVLGPRDGLAALLSGEASGPLDTRDRVLEAAARVFARKGFLGASLDEVAADAGLTKGAVYWHFKSKNDLFFALLDSRFQGTAEQHVPDAVSPEALAADPKDSLKSLLCGVLSRVKEDPDWPRLFLEFMSQAREPEVRERLATAYRQTYRISADVIAQQHAARHQSPPADPALLATFWSALMDGLVMAWLVNPDIVDLDKIVPQLVDLLWRGLDPANARPAP